MKNFTRSPFLLFGFLLGLAWLMTGCETRSISNSGYNASYGGRYGHGGGNPFYHGELSEFDVLGLQRGASVSDADINEALNAAQKIRLRKGNGLLLIQSGAILPDEPMLEAMNKYFAVTPFSGQPAGTNEGSYSKSLRMAAAQAGCESILCYWGTLESARRDLDTKGISWVPIIGGAIPDQAQAMRIRLKMAIVNVRSGQWTQFVPQPFVNEAASGEYRRAYSDQTQVEKLKRQAYGAAVEDLLKIYGS